MKKLLEDFDVIITEINNQISDKVYGINYLEKIKYLLIDRIKLLDTSSLTNNAPSENNELFKQYGENSLSIKFVLNLEPLAIIKNNTVDDHLCIVINGFKSVKIYQNLESKESHSINLFPKTGIVISKDTLISESLYEDATLLNIFNLKNHKEVNKDLI